MMRYKIELSYDGTDFSGYQIQLNATSIQGTLETMFTRLNKELPVSVIGCGRTDAGVHANFYVAHVDFSPSDSLEDTLWKLNKMLPSAISVESITLADDNFHARFDAKKRTYRYFINSKKNPFSVRYSYYYPFNLDVDKMNDAANFLLGKQDFTSFSKLHTTTKTNICEISTALWKEFDNQLVFEISADRFLRNMVRSIVGTLILVGEDRISPKDIVEIINKKDRAAAGRSVPAEGLFLWDVVY